MSRREARKHKAMVRKQVRKAGKDAGAAESIAEWGPWEDRSFTLMIAGEKKPTGMRFAFVNNVYWVQIYENLTDLGAVYQMMIGRHDHREICVPWGHLQKIKNDLGYEDRDAIECFPRTGHLVDVENIRHLWIMPAGKGLPFGLHLARKKQFGAFPAIPSDLDKPHAPVESKVAGPAEGH